jgi:hypothetical protein
MLIDRLFVNLFTPITLMPSHQFDHHSYTVTDGYTSHSSTENMFEFDCHHHLHTLMWTSLVFPASYNCFNQIDCFQCLD